MADKFKVPEDILSNRNGRVLDISDDDSIIGHHTPRATPYEPFSTGEKMRRSAGTSEVFDNNGGESKAGGAGTINKNGEYGSVTYGF